MGFRSRPHPKGGALRNGSKLSCRGTRAVFLALSASTLTAACGGGAEDAGPEEGDGTVTELWGDYCIATFVEDYEYVDGVGDVAFTAKSGDRYLISTFFGINDEIEMLYLTEDGAKEFTVPGTGIFASNCRPETAIEVYGVFSDVTVFANDNLTSPVCELSNGEVSSTGSGVGVSTIDINVNGPTTYEVYLGGFSTKCGTGVGYVSVPETTVWGTSAWMVPFQTVAAPLVLE